MASNSGKLTLALCIAGILSFGAFLTFGQGGTGRETAAPAKKTTPKKKPTHRRSRASEEEQEEPTSSSRATNTTPVNSAPRPTPTPGEYQYNEGMKYYFKSSYQEAINYFKEAILVNPGYVDAYKYLGHSYYSTNRYDEAVVVYEKLLSLVGDNPSYQCDIFPRLVYSYRKLGRTSLADDLERRLISIRAIHKCW